MLEEKVQQFYSFKEEENMKILGILIEKNEKSSERFNVGRGGWEMERI